MENNINSILNENRASRKTPGTQGELGLAIGVNREYINRIAKGKITPTVPLAMRIAQALGVNVKDEGIGKVFVLK